VLGGLTHDFAPGRMTVITGRSGAGKTTLLKLVAGLDRPSSGQVVLDGHPLGDYNGEQLASLRRERVGYLPQRRTPYSSCGYAAGTRRPRPNAQAGC
jgi:putative ABC transport system ATP-binding protein